MKNGEVLDQEKPFDCSNEIEKYKCKTCSGFQTNLLALFNTHIKNGHSDKSSEEDVYKCLKCVFISHSKYVMGIHSLFSECATSDQDERKKRFVYYRNRESEFGLRLDEPDMLTQLTLTSNLRAPNVETMFDCSSEIEKYTCTTCPNVQTNSLWSLKCHMKNGHRTEQSMGEVYKCLKCLFVTFSKYVMGSHSFLSECATSDESEKEKRFVCYKSGQPELKVELKEQPGPALPRDIHCLKFEEGMIELILKLNGESHIRSRQSSSRSKLWHCKQCTYKSTNKSYLRKHIKCRHTKPEDIKWLTCDHCPSKFKDRGILRQHIVYRHSKPEDIQWFTCAHCFTKFKKKSHLQTHIKLRHTKPEDIQWIACQHCPSKFKEKGNLKLHIIHCHSKPEDIQWFPCQQCSSKFKKKTHLQTHITYRHSKPEDIQWFKCDECSLKFKENHHLKRHIMCRHTKPEDIQWFTCQHCSSKFKQRGVLKRHIINRHTKPDDIQWFKCGQCPSKFKNNGHLKRHVISCHSKPEDIEWFTCQYCSSKYKRKADLKKHTISRHDNLGNGQ